MRADQGGMLAIYVSGHGYGHATRTAEVLRRLRARAPLLRLAVRTNAPPALFEREIAPPLDLQRVACDVGLVQKDALRIDEAGTAAAWAEFSAGMSERVAAEAEWLRAAGAQLVLGDIPPLAFAAAAAAGVPAVALGNFSWDWIYAHLQQRQPLLAQAARASRDAYRHAELMLRLPFAGDLSAFARIEDVPFVARQPRHAKRDARRRLGLDDRTAVLLSFGGIGMSDVEWRELGPSEAVQWLVTGDGRAEARGPRTILSSDLAEAGLEYVDLVAAVDVVVSKPGYGIVTDCISARTRIVYTERGDFPEYPVMVGEMPRYLPAVHAPNAAIREGRLEEALAEVLALPFPDRPRLDGAAVVADRLLGFL